MSVALSRAVRYGIRNYLRAAGVLMLVMLLIPLVLWAMMAAMDGSDMPAISPWLNIPGAAGTPARTAPG